MSAFLLRRGQSYGGKSAWTQAHYRWLEGLKFSQSVQQIVFQEYVDTVKLLSQRVAALDEQLSSAAAASILWPVIEALMALRGVSLLTATTIVAEIGDLHRFASAPQLMAYLGLVPSEHSSGGSKLRGGITKTGNGPSAASWWRPPGPIATRHARRLVCSGAPSARQRRCKRSPGTHRSACVAYRRMEGRGKLKVQACTAVARELAGFIWAIGQACRSQRLRPRGNNHDRTVRR